MTNNKIQQTTFWSFLKTRKIEIPIIQRDYAQGRKGKEELREKFLTDLKNALDHGETLKLDFVYGNVENNVLNPLDGQQRLTTLWLLHWYIAYKAGELKNNENIFKNFTYETRTSSREFCIKLSELDIEKSEENIVDLIENQTWFFSKWKQDPTIQSMLTMLGGTSVKKNKVNDIVDGFEEVFSSTENEKFQEYWLKLTDKKECPVVFYHLDLIEMKLSDDLYIKMNARGKPLTDFENFKADLIGYIRTEGIEDKIDVKEKTANKIDTGWTDIFWKKKSPDYKIDEIFYAFIKRFLLNCLITNKEEKGEQYSYTVEKLEKTNKLFTYLYGNKSDDSKVKYHGFDIYRSEDAILKNGIVRLKQVLNRLESLNDDIKNLCQPNWESKLNFNFIPAYEEKDEKYISTSLTQSQRVVFFAICCYLEYGEYDKSSFKEWMRIVWNIVENANIETIPAMIGAIRLIDVLAENSHKIYEHLKDRDISNDFAKEQMEEEKQKAIQLFRNEGSISWEEKIIEAEKYAFFKGAIRFLFRVENEEYDWGKFDDRFESVKEYFIENGVKEDHKDKLLQVFISYFDEWNMFTGMVYHNSPNSWKNVLINPKWIKPINNLLDFQLPDLNNWVSPLSESNDTQKFVHEDLVSSSLLGHVQPGCKLNWRYDRHVLYPPRANANWKKYVIGSKRNKILSSLCKNNIIDSNQKLEGLDYFWGWEIYFTLKSSGDTYQWWNCLKKKNENGDWEEVKTNDGTLITTLENLNEYLRNQ